MIQLLHSIQEKLKLIPAKENLPQVIFGLSLISCLYLMNRTKPTQEQKQEKKRNNKRSLSQKNLDQHQQRNDVLADLVMIVHNQKRSQLKINRKLNKKQHFDDSVDLTEDFQPRSPDYSVVSEVDQKFFQELFQTKKVTKKSYQTDCEDGPPHFYRSNKNQILRMAQQETEDTVFFNLYSRVVEQPEDDENDNY